MALDLRLPKTGLFDLQIILFLLVLFTFGDISSLIFGKVLIVFGIISIIQLMYRHRKVDILIIFLLFSLSYLLYMLAFYFFDIPYHYLLKYQKVIYTNNVLLLHVFFIRLMFFGLTPNDIGISRLNLKTKNNNLIFILISGILIIMFPISIIISPPSIGATYTGDIKSSIWLEYCIIFIIIGGVFANSRKKIFFLLIISSAYVLLPLLYGRRLQSIMIILTLFVLFFRNKIKVKYILVFSFCAFVFMRLYASIRVGVDMPIADSILSIDDEGVMGNNQGGVFVCSTTYWGLIQEGVFDLSFRVKSLFGVFSSIFLPASLNLKEAYINFQALTHTAIPGNGGFPSIYLFIWGGYLGVIIGALILNRIIRNKKNSNAIFIYTVFLFSTFPRWHSYNLLILIKMGFWLLFFYFLFNSIHVLYNKTYFKR